MGYRRRQRGQRLCDGDTKSPNFPTVNAVQPFIGGLSDAFVTKLNATGSALLYSTFLGGNLYDEARGIAPRFERQRLRHRLQFIVRLSDDAQCRAAE